MTAVWFAVGMFAAVYMAAAVYRKNDLFKILVTGVGFYLSFYVITAGFYIWKDAFSIDGAASLTAVLLLVMDVLLSIFWVKGLPSVRINNLKQYIPLVIVLVISFLLAMQGREGLYFMGQDSGAYQARAMFYMGGVESNTVSMGEIADINNEWERGIYIKNLSELDGYYTEDDYAEEDFSELEEVRGVFHGISTYPALLALFGKAFGLKYMGLANAIAYLILISSIWLIADNIRFAPWYRTTAAALAALSPVIIWNSRNMLPDMIFAAFLALFFELLSEGTKRRVTFVSVIPLAAGCFFHIISTMLMPMFVIIYFSNYIRTRHGGYLKALIILLASYVCGFFMMQDTAEDYMMHNLGGIYYKTGYKIADFNVKNYVAWAAVICAVCAVVLSVRKNNSLIVRAYRSAKKKKGTPGRIARPVLAVIFVILLILFIIQGINLGEDLERKRMSVMAVLQMSSYVLLPLSVAAIIRKAPEYLKDRYFATLTFSFLYMLIIYCLGVIPQIYYFYYYTRYLAVIIMLLPLIEGYMLERMNPRATIGIVIAGTVPMLLLSSILFKEKDLTYSRFEVLKSLESCITDEDALLINSQGYDEHKVYWMPLKALTGADVYFVDEDRLNNQLRKYSKDHENVFIFSYDMGRINDSIKGLREVYRGVARGSSYEENYEYFISPYPAKVVELETPVVLYIADKEDED